MDMHIEFSYFKTKTLSVSGDPYLMYAFFVQTAFWFCGLSSGLYLSLSL